MGILDFLDSPDLLGHILGASAPEPAPSTFGALAFVPPRPNVGPGNPGVAAGPVAPPMPAPVAAPPPAPGKVAAAPPSPNLMGGANFMPAPKPQAPPGLPVGQPTMMAEGPTAVASTPVPDVPGSMTPGSPAPPLPPPTTVGYAPGARPSRNVPVGPVGAPSGPGQTDFQTIGPGAAQAPGQPLSLDPAINGGAPPPAPPPSNAPATTLSGGGLESAFGISPQRAWTALASLGAGLSAVGRARPGATVGQEIGAGMGGALQGGYTANRQQTLDHFNMTSQAFKNLLASQNENSLMSTRAAQAKYLGARAQAMMTNGGNSWRSTPFGKTYQVELATQNYAKQLRLDAEQQWKMNNITPDAKAMQAKVEAFRQRMLKAAGLTAAQADKIGSSGMNKDNPIDTTGMTEGTFHTSVPMGAWYSAKGPDGKVHVYQRTAPPPQAKPPANPMSNYVNDQMALAPVQ